MLGMTTIKILRARVAYLMHENGALLRENARLRQIIDLAGVRLNEPQPRTPDYGPGGQEWVDPVSGIDTWRGAD